MELEKYLCNYINRDNCYLTGNATTAIYLVLVALGFRSRKIAIQENVCYNVPFAVFYSKNNPVFIDINNNDFNISYEELSKAPHPDALILVHSYGKIGDIKKIADFCRKKNILGVPFFFSSVHASLCTNPLGCATCTAGCA